MGNIFDWTFIFFVFLSVAVSWNYANHPHLNIGQLLVCYWPKYNSNLGKSNKCCAPPPPLCYGSARLGMSSFFLEMFGGRRPNPVLTGTRAPPGGQIQIAPPVALSPFLTKTDSEHKLLSLQTNTFPPLQSMKHKTYPRLEYPEGANSSF